MSVKDSCLFLWKKDPVMQEQIEKIFGAEVI